MQYLTDIQSDLRRRSLVALVMLLVLITAIGVASLATSMQHVVLPGVIELDIPSHWQRSRSITPHPSHWRAYAIYHSGAGQRHTLVVAGLDLGRPIPPDKALDYALTGLPAHGKGTPHDIVRVGGMVGRLFRGWSGIIIGGVQFIHLHMVAALTTDGEHYHLIYLRKLVPSTGVQPNHLTFPNTTFQDIFQSAVDLHLQPARERQITAAGFALHPPQGMRAVVQPGHLLGDGIMLVDTVAGRHLKTIRILGIADPGGQVPSDPFWPGALLTAQFTAVTGRGPIKGEVSQEIGGTLPTWWVHFGKTIERQAMIRRLAYYRLPEDRGLLLDVLAEPDSFNDQWARVDEIVKGIHTTINTIPVDPLVAITTAIRHGEAFQERQQSMMTLLLKAESHPYLLRAMGQRYGYEVRQTLKTDFDRDLPLAGLVHRRTEGPSPCVSTVDWRASADGSQCHWRTRSACATRGMQRRPADVRQSQLRIDGGQITLETATDGQAMTAWNTAVPTPFMIPPMQDRWPVALLSNPESLPMLIWTCDTRRSGPPGPPVPVWIDFQPEMDPSAWNHSNPNVADSNDVLILRHRPLMCLQADLAIVDGEGMVIQFQIRSDTGWARFPGTVTASATQWPEVLSEVRSNPGAMGWLRKLLGTKTLVPEQPQ